MMNAPTVSQETPNPTPTRLRKLMLRIAQLRPGMAYAVTLFIPEGEQEPTWTVLQLGKLENGDYRQDRKNVLG